jgi:PemK-like, MazF-like toxin of type II toxin-antitoxin system
MTDYSFGDVLLVPFPFTDQTTGKQRPAVVVSSNDYNFNRPDIVLRYRCNPLGKGRAHQTFGHETDLYHH